MHGKHMRRRDFVRSTAVLGAIGLAGQGCSSAGKSSSSAEALRFAVHPFVGAHPEAVFIHRTAVSDRFDSAALRQTGARLAGDLVVRTYGYGYPLSARVNIKPNWTCAGPMDGRPVPEKLGINTDLHFIEGWAGGMRAAGPRRFSIRECACPEDWAAMGWTAMCERSEIDLRDLASSHVWELREGRDIIFRKVSGGVMFREIAYMAPMNEGGSFLVNIAKLKSHSMGITAAVKNLQGICARRFHQFCTPVADIRKQYEPRYLEYFQDDFERRIGELHARHVREGIPRWDRPEPDGGLRQEVWAQRALDNLSVTPTALNVVEGVYSQDGDGFGLGPHDPVGPANVTSRDYLSNIIIFGVDPLRVDLATFWLAGHEPGNFGLFHLARERGMLSMLDPREIPLYEWKDGRAIRVKLESIPRTPLKSPYLRRDYNGASEPEYHLCDEPFNYSAFRSVKTQGELSPGIRRLGNDRRGHAVFDLALHRDGEVEVRIENSYGGTVARPFAGRLAEGCHEVTWDARVRPGVYSVRVRCAGWERDSTIEVC